MRIIAVTADASVLLALSVMADWEVTPASQPDEAAAKAAAAGLALIDRGSTEAGLEAARALRSHGVTIPCLVIGDAPAPPDADCLVLVRPFNFQDLSEALRHVSGEQTADSPLASALPEEENSTRRRREAVERKPGRTRRHDASAPTPPSAPHNQEPPDKVDARKGEHATALQAANAARKEREEAARKEREEAAARKAEEDARRAEEAARKQSEAAARQAVQAARKAEGAARRERKAAARRAESARQEQEAAARKAEQAARKAEEAARKRDEAAARKAERAARKQSEAALKAQEQTRRETEAAALNAREAARREQEAAARRAEEEARRAEEAARREREAEARRAEEEARRAEEAARREREAEALRAQEEARRAEEAARREREAEARRAQEATRAEEAARREREAEALRAQEEARRAEEIARKERQAATRRAREVARRAEEAARKEYEAAARKAEEAARQEGEAAARQEQEADRQAQEAARAAREAAALRAREAPSGATGRAVTPEHQFTGNETSGDFDFPSIAALFAELSDGPAPAITEPGVAPAGQPAASTPAPPAPPPPAAPPASADPPAPPSVDQHGGERTVDQSRLALDPEHRVRPRIRLGGRRLRHTRLAAELADNPFSRRARQALESPHELEALLEELPVLGEPGGMARAFLEEMVELFAPITAAVYTLQDDGQYAVAFGHGLTPNEHRMKVSPDQPLFRQMTMRGEAVLVAPVDLAQGLVAGIGGARTEALVAAPVVDADGRCMALAVAGRADFSETDLDRLWARANEAAPGFAVSELVERRRREGADRTEVAEQAAAR